LASRVTASFVACEKPPPSDRLATAGLMWLAVTQSMPAMMVELLLEPEHWNTRTPRSSAPFATPYVLPPTVPATCVPWPLQSCPLPPKPSYTLLARLPNWVCAVRMPVSMTYTRTPLPVLV
jgi:hypothetical protein